jgi:hypothetical protein
MNRQSTGPDDELEQANMWQALYDRIRRFMRTQGTEYYLPPGDCWVLDDNWGSKQQKILIRNLNLLRPPIVKSLQKMLHEFPDWEIMLAVSMPGSGWPDMGLTIRAHEIIDGLQRRYFPSDFRSIQYEGSRVGTEKD